MVKDEKKLDSSGLIDGTLNLFGIKIDLGELLGASENLKDRLEDLRENLKQAGGKEVLSDEEWRGGGATITGHIRTSGLLGEREFHLGTTGRPGGRGAGRSEPQSPEAAEPPIDVFDEDQYVTIVADVPGANPEDLELTIEEAVFSLSTREGARRRYRKELALETDVDPDSLESTCHNGVLEVRLRKRDPRTDQK